LRVPDIGFVDETGRSTGLNKSNKNSSFNISANARPPNFYDDDAQKWKDKFNKAVQDR